MPKKKEDEEVTGEVKQKWGPKNPDGKYTFGVRIFSRSRSLEIFEDISLCISLSIFLIGFVCIGLDGCLCGCVNWNISMMDVKHW